MGEPSERQKEKRRLAAIDELMDEVGAMMQTVEGLTALRANFATIADALDETRTVSAMATFRATMTMISCHRTSRLAAHPSTKAET